MSVAATGTGVPAGRTRGGQARRAQGGAVERIFAAVGADSSGPLLVRVFKSERRLELWDLSRRTGRYALVADHPFLGTSGGLAPKRRAGGHRIPEGFHRMLGLNPESRYHLSLHLDCPNASDRLLGVHPCPGDDIYIHGSAVSDGWIRLDNRAIERLYPAVPASRNAGHAVPVDIFPCRFSSPARRRLLSREGALDAELAEFWADLAEAFALFERTGVPPRVTVEASGRYGFAPGAAKAVAAC